MVFVPTQVSRKTPSGPWRRAQGHKLPSSWEERAEDNTGSLCQTPPSGPGMSEMWHVTTISDVHPLMVRLHRRWSRTWVKSLQSTWVLPPSWRIRARSCWKSWRRPVLYMVATETRLSVSTSESPLKKPFWGQDRWLNGARRACRMVQGEFASSRGFKKSNSKGRWKRSDVFLP